MPSPAKGWRRRPRTLPASATSVDTQSRGRSRFASHICQGSDKPCAGGRDPRRRRRARSRRSARRAGRRGRGRCRRRPGTDRDPQTATSPHVRAPGRAGSRRTRSCRPSRRIGDTAGRPACFAESAAEPERIAAHLLLARPAGDPWAVRMLRDAASSAIARGAPDSAVAYLRRALEEPPGERSEPKSSTSSAWRK